jgi:hypothetical protein
MLTHGFIALPARSAARAAALATVLRPIAIAKLRPAAPIITWRRERDRERFADAT